jgi:tetratricopeptide (TPR) repeat protein
MPKICLNMIVKNESRVIERLLRSVLPLIDTYCICDTGSTDNTVEIIKTFFDKASISGKIVEEPFRDFGYNRSYSLSQCLGMENADYILLLDADMVLQLNTHLSIDDFKENLKKDAYYLLQGTSKFHYKNIRIVKNDSKFSYWGVTHEYIQMPDNATKDSIPKNMLFINDIGDGGAKADKFIRDIRLLKQGLIENPDNDRYTFYLANSYKDSNQYELAIATYKKRIQIGGWKQEVWHSYYCIGLCYKELNDMKNAIYYWMEAYDYLPERIENLYEIIHYYRNNSNYVLVDVFYNLAKRSRDTINEENQLFFKKDIYDYKIDYEFSIAGYYSNQNKRNMNEIFMRVLNYPLETQVLNNTLSNYKFYVPSLINVKSPNSENLHILNNNDSNSINYPNLFHSTPSICYNENNDKLYVNTRLVNYFIDENGNYKYKNRDGILSVNDTIITKNIITIFDISNDKWVKEKEFELQYNTQHDGLYVGLEDVRMLSNKLGICFNANRGLSYGKIMIETGTIDMNAKISTSSLVYKEDSQNVEKNWVLFNTNTERVKVIYKWFPLTIGEYMVDENNKTTFFNTNIIESPPICKVMRGSTNGVNINNEIWFITHLVSHEKQRHYYHMFVVLDIDTFKVKRYSVPFTFEKKHIEYTLGFVFDKKTDNFLIGYSTMDRTTNYMNVSKGNIDKLFI